MTGDSGWVPLQMQLDYVVLKYWFRACSLPTNRYVRWTSEIANRGKVKRVSRTRNLIEKIHLENQLEGAVNEMKDVIWNALADYYRGMYRNGGIVCGMWRKSKRGFLELETSLRRST